MKIKTRIYDPTLKKKIIIEAEAYQIDTQNPQLRMERSRVLGLFTEDPGTALGELLRSKFFSEDEKNNLLYNLDLSPETAEKARQCLNIKKDENC